MKSHAKLSSAKRTHGSLHPAGSATATGFKELFSEARNSIHYWIEGCFLAETPEQEKTAESELLKFINENYTAKSPNNQAEI